MSVLKRVFVAGHKGMVGSSICRILANSEAVELVTADRAELDLCNQLAVEEFFNQSAIDEVYLAAARVGGIYANSTYPAEFIHQNLQIQCNVIHSAHINGVSKLLFLGSSCIYPKLADQPITEQALLSGHLEPTNEAYAIAKIAGIKMCDSYAKQYGSDFRSVMPTNLYGPGDNFHPQNSHVIPALIRRFHEALDDNKKDISIWGTGTPKREFLYVEDMAAASTFLMNLSKTDFDSMGSFDASHINVGSGEDCTIADLARTIAKVVNFKGNILFDSSKPDGTPRKLLNVSRLRDAGWKHKVELEEGLTRTWKWYLDHRA